MLIFVLRRLISTLPLFIFLLALTFFLLRLAPGGPFDADQAWPPEIKANIEHRYGLDLPITVQFGHWIQDALRGDLRESFQYLGRPVTQILAETLPISAVLGGWSLFFSILLGIPMGCLSAWKRNTRIDHLITLVAVSGISLPTYLVASLLILVFSLHLGWFPPALWISPASMVLPVVALGWRPMAIIARLTRTTLEETLGEDYIRTARGKGLTETAIVFKHALKNSLIPVITVLGPISANLITGSFLVEIIFQIPGMGKHFVQAILNRDYPLVMGVTLVYGVILILANLLVDLSYGWVDPRMRSEVEA